MTLLTKKLIICNKTTNKYRGQRLTIKQSCCGDGDETWSDDTVLTTKR